MDKDKTKEQKKNKLQINSINDIDKVKNRVYFKYITSKTLFTLLNVISIFLSASIIVLNLYSIRFNILPDKTMDLFVAIALFSIIITMLVSLQSFLAITNKTNEYKDKISRNVEFLKEFKEQTQITDNDIEVIKQIIE
ncbi:hypothetical protein NPA13_02405 [Mycoplasma sp. 2045]|uniref:hypothetical protein n=1 Tax=Mycoplasma sp. 2045 TaxID=2967301 RepID=UPI00211D139D|nr:hypothetical protein [Mycoplasma sp. 2045]UUM20289.1 hypothetical protein NPA13_02405 [Mycoplasma sp. 2045]